VVNRLIPVAAMAFVAACATKAEPPVQPVTADSTRTYRMGFANVPPSDDFPLAVRSLQSWATRADAAIIHAEPPWTAIYAGEAMTSIAAREYDGVVNFWRQKGLDLVIVVDPSNGVERTTDSDNLKKAGHSMTEPAAQQLYRDWVRMLVSRYHPVAIGLAAETNLVRDAAPAALYNAIRTAVNAAAADVRTIDPTIPRFITVQVEHAYGRLAGTNRYVGIGQDLIDFPFTEWIGLSSYPYLGGFSDPSQMPDDWYSKLLAGHTQPALVTEGGWSSASTATFNSSPAKQAAWIARHGQLAQAARVRYLFQLTYSDINTTVFGNDPRLLPFLLNGLVDTTIAPKPALAEWDKLFARKRTP
jgi:hypothetical protein